ncbi:16S rRNA (guanine(527)-N(7))-methyltransferase RsmG [Aliishimia ponticola]|uniref:Ribosomal RNA small subunit methyltransferase G n=1 Tax=Aliishimia ponticola TaxID=2499833 RepID=A0A4V3XJY5_9RHOB|nr:16S rRNA (guanine(527)-N(7))-methyltransferase RsmG [Aliishimia ponticola]
MSSVGFDVSRETLDKLARFQNLVERWTPRINLVAPKTVPEIWTRHIVDSAQLCELASVPTHWVDIGSGGGFPGIVVAVILAEKSPDAQVTMIESDKRKCVFLKSALRELEVKATVLNDRVERQKALDATVLSARALAPLSTLLAFADGNLAKGGEALFMKGENWKSEVYVAQEEWSFDLEVVQSNTNPDAAVLKITNLKRKQ